MSGEVMLAFDLSDVPAVDIASVDTVGARIERELANIALSGKLAPDE